MVISMHQPEHLPWLGFFHKMSLVEVFVLMDIVQYTKQNWQNRNRIRTSHGFNWIIVPIITRGKRYQKINEAEIDWRDSYWPKRIIGAIENNYSRAPYFSNYCDELEKIYCDIKWNKLVDLNITLINELTSWLGIKTKCKKLNAKTYLSGKFGKNYLEEFKFEEADIRLEYHTFHHPEYKQRYDPFIPEMSAIDLLMCHGENSFNILTSV